MNKQRKVLITFLSVILVNCLYAGFLDGLKKVGEGVADVAGGMMDTTVNATTSVVQSVKQQTVFADPSTHSVSSIFFKDTLLAAKLMELCRNQKAAAKKSEAEAKAAAEKKAKSDSLNF